MNSKLSPEDLLARAVLVQVRVPETSLFPAFFPAGNLVATAILFGYLVAELKLAGFTDVEASFSGAFNDCDITLITSGARQAAGAVRKALRCLTLDPYATISYFNADESAWFTISSGICDQPPRAVDLDAIVAKDKARREHLEAISAARRALSPNPPEPPQP